jgi:hypothetical protein
VVVVAEQVLLVVWGLEALAVLAVMVWLTLYLEAL